LEGGLQRLNPGFRGLDGAAEALGPTTRLRKALILSDPWKNP
jgi:hypothetical protein